VVKDFVQKLVEKVIQASQVQQCIFVLKITHSFIFQHVASAIALKSRFERDLLSENEVKESSLDYTVNQPSKCDTSVESEFTCSSSSVPCEAAASSVSEGQTSITLGVSLSAQSDPMETSTNIGALVSESTSSVFPADVTQHQLSTVDSAVTAQNEAINTSEISIVSGISDSDTDKRAKNAHLEVAAATESSTSEVSSNSASPSSLEFEKTVTAEEEKFKKSCSTLAQEALARETRAKALEARMKRVKLSPSDKEEAPMDPKLKSLLEQVRLFIWNAFRFSYIVNCAHFNLCFFFNFRKLLKIYEMMNYFRNHLVN
jgi:hypothetical protein